MLIVGAKGMAKEILEILSSEKHFSEEDLVFFDNINKSLPHRIYDRYDVLSTFSAASKHFSLASKKFILGLGNPYSRRKMAKEFSGMGGELTSVISIKANIGSFNTEIGKGCIVMPGAIISCEVTLGDGVLLNYNSTISHESQIGNFVEIACGVNIPGRCRVGDNVFIGTNAVLNPDISIGKNAIIGAGSVVIENVPPNCTVAGNPAKILKRHV